MRRALKRIGLGLLAALVLAIGGAMVFVHTSYGREMIRSRLEARLAKMVTGTATIGSVEGSPFTTLVLRDIAIDDEHGHPVLRIATLRADVALLPLLKKHLRVDRLIADGVAVEIAREAGGHGLLTTHGSSAWDLELPRIEISHGRIASDVVTVEGISVHGRLSHPHGEPLRADLAAYGTSPEHGPVFAMGAVRQELDHSIAVPWALATAEGALVAASGVDVRALSGAVLVAAPKRVAGIELPDRVAVLATVWPDRFVDAVGTLGDSPLQLLVQLDLPARRVHGLAITGGVEVPRGRAGGVATFDVTAGDPDGLPVGIMFATVWAELDNQPRAQLGAAIVSDGAVASVAVDGTARATRISASGRVSRLAKELALSNGWLVARSSEVPDVGGTVTAKLTGGGALWPRPDLAIAGSIDGTALRVRDFSAASIHVGLEARHLPGQPAGKAAATIAGLARGTTQLGALQLTAASRADGKLAVALASQLRVGWLLESDALVTAGPTVDIAFGHHRVRLGGSATWAGRDGHVTISPAKIAVIGMTSASENGALALDATWERHSHRASLDASVHGLRGRPLERPLDIRIAATTDEHQTRGTIALRGPGQVNLGDLAIAIPRAAMAIRRDAPIAGTLTLTTAPAPMFAMMLGRDQLTGGTVDGTVEIGGTIAAPALAAKLVATNLAVFVGKTTTAIDRLAIRGGISGGLYEIAIDGAEKGGGALTLVVRGPVARPAEIATTMVAKHFDLAPILALLPGRAMGGAGRLDANLSMRGLDPRTATFSGELHLVDGRLPLSPSAGTLQKATFDAVIAHDTIQLALAGKLGAGTVVARGTIGLVANASAVGQVDIQLRKVSPIGVLQPAIDADLTAKVRRETRRIVADVVVDNGVVVMPKHRGQKLASVGAPQEMRFVSNLDQRTVPHAKAKHPPEEPVLVANITIHTTRVIDEEIRGVITGQLVMSSDREAFGVVGSIHAERGEANLFGRRYTLDRGSLYFDGATDPLLDFAITHDYADVSTTTTIRGRLSKPVVAMSASTGVYSQGQLLGFMLGGEPTGDPRDVAARDRAAAAGESVIANQVGADLRGGLPIKVVRYEAGTATNSAALTAGTWLTHELFVAYRRHLEGRPDENSGEAEVEYWIGHHTSIEGTVGDRGYDGIDLLWRKRY